MKKAFIIHMIYCLILTSGLIWGVVETVDLIVNKDVFNFLCVIPMFVGFAAATVHILTSPMSRFRKF